MHFHFVHHVAHVLRICEPTIQRGVMGEHTIPDMYNTVYNMKQALEGGEEGYLMKDTRIYCLLYTSPSPRDS